MKILSRLEKAYEFWILLFISFVFFLLRLPSLVEPYWYGDEGIYQTLGTMVRNGSILYVEAWDNKPPLLYVLYALFSSDQFALRLVSLVIGIITIIIFFYLGKLLFKKTKIALITTATFALLFATPLIEGNIANAENFMLVFILAAGVLIYRSGVTIDTSLRKTPTKNIPLPFYQSVSFQLFLSGILVGVAFLFKIVALFDLGAFIVFLFSIHVFHRKRIEIPFTFLSQITFLVLGFVIPFFISIFYFFRFGKVVEYIQSIFLSNIAYVNVENTFFIPQGFLFIKIALLLLSLFSIIYNRRKFTPVMLFILIWFVFSVFNAYFSQRPYTHYMLVLLPSWSLLIGLAILSSHIRKLSVALLVVISCLLILTFEFYPLKKTIMYYDNYLQYISNKKDLVSYQSFFDARTPTYYDIAMYLKIHTQPNDPVFIWGNAAQIYTLSETLPINRYTVAYHISEREDAIKDTEEAIRKVKPHYAVIYPDLGTPPVTLVEYDYKVTIHEALIYERIY